MSYNYEYRMHDPRLGRFLSVDPLSPEYPWNSPYAFSENTVIAFVELKGLEAICSNVCVEKTKGVIVVTGTLTIKVKVINLSSMETAKIIGFDRVKSESVRILRGFSGGEADRWTASDIDKCGQLVEGKDAYPAKVRYDVSINVSFSDITSLDKIGPDDYVIAIVDDIPKGYTDGYGDLDPAGVAHGKAAIVELGSATTSSTHVPRVMGHEMGHWFGILDWWHANGKEEQTPNLYNYNTNSTNLTGQQKFEGMQRMFGDFYEAYKATDYGANPKHYGGANDAKGDLKYLLDDQNVKTNK